MFACLRGDVCMLVPNGEVGCCKDGSDARTSVVTFTRGAVMASFCGCEFDEAAATSFSSPIRAFIPYGMKYVIRPTSASKRLGSFNIYLLHESREPPWRRWITLLVAWSQLCYFLSKCMKLCKENGVASGSVLLYYFGYSVVVAKRKDKNKKQDWDNIDMSREARGNKDNSDCSQLIKIICTYLLACCIKPRSARRVA